MTDAPNTPTPLADDSPAETEPEQERKFQFPSAFTVLAIVALAVWALAFIIPSGEYQLDEGGAPVAGSYQEVPAPQDFEGRVSDLFLSPVNGLYGVQDAETGAVRPDASGELFGAAGVFLFVLAIVAFVTMMLATGALDSGIARLAYKVRGRGWLLIVAIMSVFSLLGSVEGMAEETLGFYGLIVPLMLALGYDRMVAVGVIIVGAGVGVMGSTVNPFSIGVASGFSDVSIGDGIVLRLVMWLVLSAVAIAYVVRYARKVQANPDASIVGVAPGDRERAAQAAATQPPPLTTRHKTVLTLVVLTFAFMIFSIIPWAGIFSGPDAIPYSWELGWWFPELTVFFIVAAIVIGIVGGLGEHRLTDTLGKGAGDFIYPALVIVLARGVTVIMNNAKITDTVLHSVENVAEGSGSGIFAIVIFLVNLPLAFLIPSTSGHATLAMPILAPLGDFANVDRSLVITSWNAASGFMNLWVPTTAVVMGGIALAKVGYNEYLRFLAPLLGILFVLTCMFLAVGAALS